MNLIEAVKSGLPFRRCDREWMTPKSWSKAFIREDVLADDWEIQEPAIPITRTQFWQAAKQALIDVGADRSRLLGVADAMSDKSLGYLARHLGLEAKE